MSTTRYRKRKKGKSIDQVIQWLEENKLNLCHWFTVDDLNHLKRGGRVSPATAFFGTMLNIKPVLHVDDEGHLIPMGKVRGRKASLDALVDHMAQTAINPKEQVIFISHGDSEADAKVCSRSGQSEIQAEGNLYQSHRSGDRRSFRPRYHGAVFLRQQAVRNRGSL